MPFNHIEHKWFIFRVSKRISGTDLFYSSPYNSCRVHLSLKDSMSTWMLVIQEEKETKHEVILRTEATITQQDNIHNLKYNVFPFRNMFIEYFLFLTINIRQINFVLVIYQNISRMGQSHLPLGVLVEHKTNWLDTSSILVLNIT